MKKIQIKIHVQLISKEWLISILIKEPMKDSIKKHNPKLRTVKLMNMIHRNNYNKSLFVKELVIKFVIYQAVKSMEYNHQYNNANKEEAQPTPIKMHSFNNNKNSE